MNTILGIIIVFVSCVWLTRAGIGVYMQKEVHPFDFFIAVICASVYTVTAGLKLISGG